MLKVKKFRNIIVLIIHIAARELEPLSVDFKEDNVVTSQTEEHLADISEKEDEAEAEVLAEENDVLEREVEAKAEGTVNMSTTLKSMADEIINALARDMSEAEETIKTLTKDAKNAETE